jgi:hypothetical protein
MEAVKHNLRTVNYGPWEKQYIALCGPKGARVVLGGGFMQKVVQVGVLPIHEKPTTKGE